MDITIFDLGPETYVGWLNRVAADAQPDKFFIRDGIHLALK